MLRGCLATVGALIIVVLILAVTNAARGSWGGAAFLLLVAAALAFCGFLTIWADRKQRAMQARQPPVWDGTDQGTEEAEEEAEEEPGPWPPPPPKARVEIRAWSWRYNLAIFGGAILAIAVVINGIDALGAPPESRAFSSTIILLCCLAAVVAFGVTSERTVFVADAAGIEERTERRGRAKTQTRVAWHQVGTARLVTTSEKDYKTRRVRSRSTKLLLLDRTGKTLLEVHGARYREGELSDLVDCIPAWARIAVDQINE